MPQIIGTNLTLRQGGSLLELPYINKGVPVNLKTEEPNFQLAHIISWGPRSLCSYLKHDLAWNMFCGAMFKGFACASERQHLGYHRL